MRALQMHRSLLFFGYELIVDALRLAASDCPRRARMTPVRGMHPALAARSAIARTHQTGQCAHQLLRVHAQ